MRNYILITAFLTFLGHPNQNRAYHETIEDEAREWNVQSLNSINEQAKEQNSTQLEENLQHEAKDFTFFFQPNPKEKNGKRKDLYPFRMSFLKTLYSKIKIKPPFFIIEAQGNGEVVDIKKYVVIENNKNSRVIFFDLVTGKWLLIRDSLIDKTNLGSTLNNTSKNIGLNDHDLFLSKFDKHKIKSRYFYNNTIAKYDPVISILDIENN